MKNTLYPLSLSAYYLNFTYPGHLNLETRVFLCLPFPGQSMEKSNNMDLLEICFEMNSVFNKYESNSKEDNIDLGLKIMVGTKQLNLPEKNIKDYFQNEMVDDGVTTQKHHFFNSEEDLYKSIKPSLSKFLLDSYGKHWMNFTKNSRDKYLSGNLSSYATKEEKDEANYLQKQLVKIDMFVEETQKRMEGLLNASQVDEQLLKQLNLTFNSSGSGIVSQILGSVPLNDRQEVVELNKVIKTFHYHALGSELPKQDSSKPKVKKI